MKLSNFAKVFQVNDNIFAYYHSLRMLPVYLTRQEHEILQHDSGLNLTKSVIDSLKEAHILSDDESEANLIARVQNCVPKPYICVAYLILTEQCNFACKYCFLGNSSQNPKATDFPMSKDTAMKALEFFAEQTRYNPEYFNEEKNIIFYGGEPLLNFETLKFVVQKSREFQEKNLISQNLHFSIVTNGTLLDQEKIQFLINNRIETSISLDGATQKANSSRIYKNGAIVHDDVLRKIALSKNLGLDVGLSVTLTEEALEDMNSLITLLQKLDIKSLCFNLLHRNENLKIDEDYYRRASDFIIKFYNATKDSGIYEERFARKLQSFVAQKIYFSDCAATSGNQIVITPDGKVGICQACTEKREYFISDVNASKQNLNQDTNILNWQKFTPIFKNECVSCEALGICGGGCPVNARSLNEIDSLFCVHAKKSLEFLISKLYSVMNDSRISPENLT